LTVITSDNQRFATLLQLEQRIRGAETLVELRFIIANESRTLVEYAQCALLSARDDRPHQVVTVADLPVVDRTAPFVVWAEQVVESFSETDQVQVISRDDLTPDIQQRGSELAPSHLLWVPLSLSGRGLQGGMLLTRTIPWSDAEISLLAHLGHSYGHALWAIAPRRTGGWLRPWKQVRKLSLLLAVVFVGLLFLPLRLSVLAPAEVVPLQPAIMTAPLQGVVKQIEVLPNDRVKRGDLLLLFEETELKSRLEVAQRALEVATAELHKTRQSAFVDSRAKGDISGLEAQLDLHRAERDFARAQFNKVQLFADRAGVVVLNDPQSWLGRPVAVGERILSIADPLQVELVIHLPVADAVVLRTGSAVTLFLDMDPLNALEAEVVRADYEPKITAEGGLAYRVTARFSERTAPHPRIGLRGTAKVYGAPVTLFYYLLRRPITVFRQWIGV